MHFSSHGWGCIQNPSVVSKPGWFLRPTYNPARRLSNPPYALPRIVSTPSSRLPCRSRSLCHEPALPAAPMSFTTLVRRSVRWLHPTYPPQARASSQPHARASLPSWGPKLPGSLPRLRWEASTRGRLQDVPPPMQVAYVPDLCIESSNIDSSVHISCFYVPLSYTPIHVIDHYIVQDFWLTFYGSIWSVIDHYIYHIRISVNLERTPPNHASMHHPKLCGNMISFVIVSDFHASIHDWTCSQSTTSCFCIYIILE